MSDPGHRDQTIGAVASEDEAAVVNPGPNRPPEALKSTLAGGVDPDEASAKVAFSHDASVTTTGIGAFTPTGPADSPPAHRPAPTIAGYQIDGELGRGAMGVVYLARQVGLNRPCALKVILAGVHADPVAAVRFLGEAEAVAKLQHPNIVQIHNVGESDGLPFLELEYVPGGSLDRALDGTPWPARRAATLAETLAHGVAEAHRLGIIHRDLKPSNILIANDGTPKIADFGLAKVLNVESALTATDSIMGSPSYMAPEQAEGKARQVGPLADVYALGAVLYELLVGRPPFRGTTVLETLEQVRTAEPVPPTRLVPGLPRDLETIVLKCLQKDPAKRYGSAAALAEDLRRFLAGEPILARRTGPVERGWRWCRRNPAVASLWVALIGILLAGTAIATYYAVRAREGERLAMANARRADERAEELQRRDYINRVNLALSECLGNNVTRALELLDGCPEDLRGWEWSYAERQCHLDLGTFRQSGETLNGVAFSPDGTRVASVSGAYQSDEPALRGDLVVRNVVTGQEIFPPRNVASGFRGVVFSPDGRWIATGNASDLVIWDAATGKEEFRLRDPGNRDHTVLSLAFSPDGRRIIAGYAAYAASNKSNFGGHANLWDLTSRKPIEIPGNRRRVLSVAFSHDGREVALASDGLVEVCDVEAPTRPIRALRGHTGFVYAVAFSPDGRYLASGGLDRTVWLWDRTGHEIRPFYGHEGRVRGLAFSPDSQWLISASEDRSLRLWEVASGRPLADFHGHQSFTSCVAFSPHGRLFASGGMDHAVKLWLATPSPQLTFTGHDGWVHGVAFSSDGRRIVSGAGSLSPRGLDYVMRWDATTGEPLEPSFEGCPKVWAVELDRDGRRLATACRDGTVRVWDIDTGRPVWKQQGHAIEVYDVAYSPDGRWLASAGGNGSRPLESGETRLWDAETGREIRTFVVPTAAVFGVAFSPDSRWLASGCGDGIVRIWDTWDPASKARELPRQRGGVGRVVFLPDGRLASAGGSSSVISRSGSEFGEVKIWDLSTGRALDLRGHSALVWGLASSPDGRRLATGSDDRTIKLWDTRTGEEVFTLRGHTSGVTCVAFSPDGRRLASGGWDRTVRVWDTDRPPSHALSRRGAESRARQSELPDNPFAP